MREFWNFYSAGRLVFGNGSVRQLGRLTAERGLQRMLVISDPAIVQAGLVDRVVSSLKQAGIVTHVFEGGEPEPSKETAQLSISEAHRFKPDSFLGLGGGSNMDLSKITSMVFSGGGELDDYIGFNTVKNAILPVVAVPTTSGTGSEVSHAAVLTDHQNQIKVSTLSQFLRPSIALVDPEMSYSCPPKATADSGIDALTHAIEAYTAVPYQNLAVPMEEPTPYDGKTPMGDCLAEKAIRLIGKHLIRAVHEPENAEAREGMSLAATLAGLAFSNCAVAVVHALEYPLGAILHCSHGAGNGLLLPFVMKYNLATRIKEFADIAEWLGEDISGMAQASAADQSIIAVENLKQNIGIPKRIRDLGATREQLPLFAEKAFAIKRLMKLNPRNPTQEELLKVYQDAF
ncbi:MAG TPA: iron-containing alcohol dehydrogenase [Verrucomicrobiales bacterium]|nr:iron-containing alcohol dehydrogenase [Verrucomicrobiales bacterium]